jgi:hypothetical protein
MYVRMYVRQTMSVRQLIIRQVFESTESTKRQYALRQHAVALGWPVEQIVVIDSDLGQSGASAVDREDLAARGRTRHGQGWYRTGRFVTCPAPCSACLTQL